MIENFDKSSLSSLPSPSQFFTLDKIKYLALDTEAYDNGKPFLIMLSNGDNIPLEYPLYYLLNKYTNYHFFTYNLKYDMGNLIRDYNLQELIFLKRYGEVFILEHNNDIIEHNNDIIEHNNDIIEPYTLQYIKPYKSLIVKSEKYKNKKIYFWDLAQYFMLSLDEASKKYLNRRKIELPTKKFTLDYVKKNFKIIKKYCLYDCILTFKLATIFIKSFKKIKLKKVIGFYSGASIASSFFICKTKVSTFGNYFNNLEFLNFMGKCYRGGKFEMTQRGYFEKIYEYDINSAYSYELSKLYDTRFSYLEKFNKKIPNDCVYGFYKVKLYNVLPEVHLPCGCKDKDKTLIFPCGNFETYVTLQELQYIEKLGIEYKIIDGYNIRFNLLIKPYEKIINDLFKLKKEYKIKKDIMGYNLVKIISNGFYGKTVQITKCIDYKIEDFGDEKYFNEIIEDYEYKLGSCFNIIHGTIITANTRIKITELQNKYKNDCIAVHTDSVFLKKELEKDYISDEIGKFSYEDCGRCLMIGLGQYKLNGYNATRGINSENFDWEEELKKNPFGYSIKVKSKFVNSWVEGINKGNKDLINLFLEEEKIIDLNVDTKRVWNKKFRCIDFLEKNEISEPIRF